MNNIPTTNSKAYIVPGMGDDFYTKHNITPPEWTKQKPKLFGPVVEVVDEYACWILQDGPYSHKTLYEYSSETDWWHPTCIDYGHYKVDLQYTGLHIRFSEEAV